MNDLEQAVRSTAARVPAAPPDLGAVLGRARRIRRRRAITGAAAAVVTVAALAAVVPQVLPRRDVVAGDPLGGSPIGLWLDRAAPPATRGLPAGRHVPGSSGEVAAQLVTVDGKPVIRAVADPQPGLEGGTYLGPAPLPDGGLATVGLPAGGGGYRVVVTGADGRVTSNERLPESHTSARRPVPMTGNGTSLFWWHIREDSPDDAHPVFLTYDIATATLNEVTPSTAVTGGEVPYFGMQATADRIVEWPATFGRNCSFEILDAARGERLAHFQPDLPGCSDAYFALSPDNRHVAALVTTRSGGERTQRVVVLDAATGREVRTFDTPGPVTASLSGLAWAGPGAIRYVRGDLEGGDPSVLTMTM